MQRRGRLCSTELLFGRQISCSYLSSREWNFRWGMKVITSINCLLPLAFSSWQPHQLGGRVALSQLGQRLCCRVDADGPTQPLPLAMMFHPVCELFIPWTTVSGLAKTGNAPHLPRWHFPSIVARWKIPDTRRQSLLPLSSPSQEGPSWRGSLSCSRLCLKLGLFAAWMVLGPGMAGRGGPSQAHVPKAGGGGPPSVTPGAHRQTDDVG